MVIRKIPSRAASSVLPLFEAQYRDHGIDMRGAPLRKALAELLRGHGFVLAAFDPGPIGVAAISWEWSLERGGRQAWLEELYVTPDRRGEGVGRALLLQAVAAATAFVRVDPPAAPGGDENPGATAFVRAGAPAGKGKAAPLPARRAAPQPSAPKKGLQVTLPDDEPVPPPPPKRVVAKEPDKK